MTPDEYDAWYDTPRGRWIGGRELALAVSMLDFAPGATLLDAGCGTGWFTRRFSEGGFAVTGLDPDGAALEFARSRDDRSRYVAGDARQLPFPDAAFDGVACITALNFMPDPQRAVAELVRVCRRRFVVGVLNRHSRLFRDKGRDGGTGAYRGAHWFTPRELRVMFEGLPVSNLTLRSTVYFPSAGPLARCVEPLVPAWLPGGSVLLLAGDVNAEANRQLPLA